jgi:probable rRNA maturation factor
MVDIVYMKEVPGLDPDFFLRWLTKVVEEEGKLLGDICLVLGDDEWLKDHNVQFLNHDYYTDIITFDYSTNDLVSGDLLISLDRVVDNALSLGVPEQKEFNRVVVHGVLHLCGYGDKSHEELLVMRKKEDYYLSLL